MAIIFGTVANDSLSGTDTNDLIFGLAGNDTLSGGLGKDWLFGGDGNDSLSGGDGSDLLYGDAGNDSLNGDAGDDLLIAGAGGDSLNGGTGKNTLIGVDPFNPNLGFGRNEQDTLYGGGGENLFVLGNVQLDGSKAVFYRGEEGNAFIRDFIFGQDKIQLAGAPDDYVIEPIRRAAAAIYYRPSGSDQLDLIAAVLPPEGSPGITNLSDPNQFVFV